jgi:hypothetical protein
MIRKKTNFLFAILSSAIVFIACSKPERIEIGSSILLRGVYPSLTCGIAAHLYLTKLPDQVVLYMNGKGYGYDEIKNMTKSSFGKNNPDFILSIEEFVEAELLRNLGDGAVSEQKENFNYVEAKYRLIEKISGSVSVSSDESMNYYIRNKIWFSEPWSIEMNKRIEVLVLEEKKQDLYDEYIYDMLKDNHVYISVSWVMKASDADLGNPARQTIGNGKKCVLIFSYGCCKPDVMLPEIAPLKEMLGDDAEIIHIDSKILNNLAERFRVTTNPTTLIFDQRGNLAKSIRYRIGAEEIISLLTGL